VRPLSSRERPGGQVQERRSADAARPFVTLGLAGNVSIRLDGRAWRVVVPMTVGLGVGQGWPSAAIPAREADDLIEHGTCEVGQAYASTFLCSKSEASPDPAQVDSAPC
jgi:hypothetical protein